MFILDYIINFIEENCPGGLVGAFAASFISIPVAMLLGMA